MVAERIVHPEAEYSTPVVAAAMAVAPAQPRPLRWTKQEYQWLSEQGVFQDRRVELIEGEIVEMSPMNAPHWKACLLTRDVLQKTFGEGYIVTDQLPISIVDESQPQPDVAVIQGRVRDFGELPTQAVLAVEVSDSTLRYDQERKLKLYARAGLAEYWILDLNARQLIVHRQPDAQNERYQLVQILSAHEAVAPQEAPQSAIKVADLLP
jgi:Uma2 family endonuclease